MKISIAAGDSHCDVIIGPFDALEIAPQFVITDENVWTHQGHRLGLVDHVLVLPPGEQTKSVQWFEHSHRWLVECGAGRKSELIAFGGGVVSDLAGFVAATFMRGINHRVIATTLMAQVDAAIGGKTGIDLPEGKNLVGSFHHPKQVWCDATMLETLSAREYANGVAEVIKYAVIAEPTLFELLKDKGHGSVGVQKIVERCVRIKADIVRRDPLESSGERAVLNFGHTVGHAIESCLGYAELLHGEAVMIGMIVEAEIGRRLGVTPPEVRERLEEMAVLWELPAKLPRVGLVPELLAKMRMDKKSGANKIAMALPTRLGACHLLDDIEPGLVEAALEGF